MLEDIANLSQPGFTNRYFLTASMHGASGGALNSLMQMVMERRPMAL